MGQFLKYSTYKLHWAISGKNIKTEKAIATAIPTYSMSIFHLPLSFYHDIQSMVARYWWGGDDSSKKMHWWFWEKLCRPKSEGGLGFKDISTFNQSL